MTQQVNLPGALPSVPGFSEQQVHGLINIVHSIMLQYFAPPNQNQITSAPIPSVETSPSPQYQPPSTPPSSTPSTPQEAQKEEDEQLLQQVTVKNITESITESITKHSSSIPDRKSTLSTIPRLYTARSSGDLATCLSNALLCAYQSIMFLNTLLGYIKHSKGREATGQG